MDLTKRKALEAAGWMRALVWNGPSDFALMQDLGAIRIHLGARAPIRKRLVRLVHMKHDSEMNTRRKDRNP